MKKIIGVFIFAALMGVGQALAQNGTVRGNIAIKKMSGNNLGNFGCSNLTVTVASFNKKRPYSWQVADTAKGVIKDGRCSYSINDVPMNGSFTVSLSANFPKTCDLKIFKPDSSFPMKRTSRGPFEYNPAVHEIACTIVK